MKEVNKREFTWTIMYHVKSTATTFKLIKWLKMNHIHHLSLLFSECHSRTCSVVGKSIAESPFLILFEVTISLKKLYYCNLSIKESQVFANATSRSSPKRHQNQIYFLLARRCPSLGLESLRFLEDLGVEKGRPKDVIEGSSSLNGYVPYHNIFKSHSIKQSFIRSTHS